MRWLQDVLDYGNSYISDNARLPGQLLDCDFIEFIWHRAH